MFISAGETLYARVRCCHCRLRKFLEMTRLYVFSKPGNGVMHVHVCFAVTVVFSGPYLLLRLPCMTGTSVPRAKSSAEKLRTELQKEAGVETLAYDEANQTPNI